MEHAEHVARIAPAGVINFFFLHSGLLHMGYMLTFPLRSMGQ